MYKKSKEKSEKIIRLFKEGVGFTQICKLTTSSQPTVKKVLSHHGIDYNLEKSREYTSKLNQVLEMYQQGESQCTIEKTLNLTRKTIRTYLKSREVDYRDKSAQQHIRYNTQVDHHAFDKLNPESLYWIGMFYTDGHIEQKRDAAITLTVHNNDQQHLEKLKYYLKSNRLISKDHGDCMRLRINSRRLRDKLVELGFTSNKSRSIAPHVLLKESRDFWRGCVDGDGGVYNYPSREQIFLCGTLETVFEFIIFCNKYCGVKDKYPSPCTGKNLYQVHFYGKDAKLVAHLLYHNAQVYLDRKYNTYLEWTQDN